MIFAQFVVQVNEANSFIVGCEETREAMLVDAACLDPRFPRFLDAHGLRLTTVFITHDHHDHTGGLKEIRALFPGAVIHAGTDVAGGIPVHKVNHGDTIHFGAISGKVVALPGHTPESIGLILPNDAFTGDALFAGSVGGTATPANAQQQLQHIRENLFTLPDHCRLHAGHGPSTTVGIEKRRNPFFTTDFAT